MDGVTALIYSATFNSNDRVLAVILIAGADASIKDIAGLRALDYAKINVGFKGTKTLDTLVSVTPR
jgi:hypothetical protein